MSDIEEPTTTATDENNASADNGLVHKSAKGKRGTRMSKSLRAGLHVPISKINKSIANSRHTSRVSAVASVYMAAALEYVLAEIIETTGANMEAAGTHKRMTPRDVLVAIQNDPDLSRLLAGHRVLCGGPLRKVSQDLVLESDRKYKTERQSKSEDVNANNDGDSDEQ